MPWRRRKSNVKLAENQPSPPSFPATGSLSSFSLRRGPQPPPPLSLVFPPSSPPQKGHQNISRGGCTASLSPLQNFSYLPPRPRQQQPSRPEALVPPNGS